MGFNCGLKEPSTQGSFFFLQKKKMDQSIKLEKYHYIIYKINTFTYSTTNKLVITIETTLEKKDQKIEEQIRKEVSKQLVNKLCAISSGLFFRKLCTPNY